mmetsp:Transcript_15255/g.25121  ORF Transcript_15255/g.25121 Transcript_15255/m.25121 type:complete len:1394 (-) Transcript_15255:3081-7262(-)
MREIDDDDNTEMISTDSDDYQSGGGGTAPPTTANDSVVNGDITNDHDDGTHAPSQPSSPLHAESPINDPLSDDDNVENEEAEEYETSYAKLQKLRRKYGASDNTDNAAPAEDSRDEEGHRHNNTVHDDNDGSTTPSPQEHQQRQRRRRRGGYGSSNNNNAASVLETLSDKEGTSAGAATSAGGTSTAEDNDNNVADDSWNFLDNLDIVEEAGETSNLFLEDDDATRPYDDRSGDNDEEETEMEEYEHVPTAGRGRTKKQNRVIQTKDVEVTDEVEEESQQPAEHEPSNEGRDDAFTATTTTTTSNPTNKQVITLVDKLFQAADKDSMTVGGILSYVAEHFGFKDKKALGKERKQMIKERLTLLISGTVDIDNDNDSDEEEKKSKKKAKKKKKTMEVEEAVEYSDVDDDLDVEDDEDAGGNDSSSDYEEKAPSKKRNSKKARKKKSTSVVDDGEDSDQSDYSDSSRTKKRSSSSKRSKRRSKESSKKGKMKNHLRDEATKRRLRQMEEARIRQEEMGHLADDHNDDAVDGAVDSKSKVKSEEEKANAGPKISEQDRQRAMAIAARFDTNREELRVKREEDRVGLIEKLRQRRLESITSNDFLKEDDTSGVEEDKDDEKTADVKEEGLPLSALAWGNNEGDGNGMIDLDDDSDDDDSDDGGDVDDELEIMEETPSAIKAPMNATLAKSKSKSIFDSLLSNHGKDAVRRPIAAQKKSKSVANNPRMALRMALRQKQVKAGNRWLARELGYKTEEDHIRDCKDVEDKKRKQIFLLEKEAVLREVKNVGLAAGNYDVEEELRFDDSGDAVNYDEEDDEMAMARELNQLEEATNSEDATVDRADGDGNVEQNITTVLQFSGADHPDGNSIADGSKSNDDDDDRDIDALGKPTAEGQDNASSPDTIAVSESGKTVVTPTASNDTEETAESGVAAVTKLVTESKDAAEDTEESEFNISTEESGPKKPRNSAWQAMLRKEKEDIAKQKRRQRKGGGLVEGEAEEEEEEEGIVGLEDFGFAVQKKKGDDDDDVDDAEVDEDDLEHVVDDVSDGEGDEEAGEVARKRLEAKEEKERHKEIMRRMREGYGGRDRGIASGVGGARGMHRFDVLVGADNRDEAKQLGLLNDDELDSDNEGEEKYEKKEDDEEEDEAALLDKMLKERFLQKQNDDFLEENFSDDEEEEDDEDGSGENKDGDDDEDKEQDRLAKRFAKKARMNRILEAYEGDSQFSRSRLIDEDESTQNDLKAMKTSLSRKRGSVSMGDRSKDTKENDLNDSSKRQKGTSSNEEKSNAPKSSRFLANESSLSVALIANRHAGRKRKTTFINGKQNSSFVRKNSTCSSKSLSLNHVVFMAGESQTLSRMDSSSNSFMKSIKSTSVMKKSSKQVSRGSSLWSRVCSKNLKG